MSKRDLGQENNFDNAQAEDKTDQSELSAVRERHYNTDSWFLKKTLNRKKR